MAFEKAKVLKAAEKFLSQGKINAAIKEYRQIVDNDADDLTTLNMLGDLYVRSGKKEEAVSCFERIAEHYSAQEFNLKAIAMYRKIERLRTHDPIIASKLAEGYVKENMRGEAADAFVQAANRLHQTGAHEKALEAYSNALQLVRDDREALRGMLETHIARGTADEAAEVLERAVEGKEEDPELVSMLARAYLEAEDAGGAERATSLLMAQDP